MENRKRIYSLDVLKFVCALLIVFHHFQQVTGIRFNTINFFGGEFYYGYLVELFFMISGFLCIYNYKECPSLHVYLYRRFRKIVPITVLSVLLIYCVELINYFVFGHSLKTDGLGIWTVFTSITLTYGVGIFDPVGLGINNPLWYLCVLIVCCCLFYTINKNKMKFRYHYLLLPLVSLGLQKFDISLPFLTSRALRGYVAFFIGVLAYFIYGEINEHTNVRRVSILLLLILIILIVLGLINFHLFYDNLYYILICLIYPIVLLLLLYFDKYIRMDSIKTLGNISLEMYIWHPFLLKVLETLQRLNIVAFSDGNLILMLVFSTVTIVFSWIFVKYFEDKTQRLFHNIITYFLK